MKTFNIIMETSIEAESQEAAEAFAFEKLSIVDTDANLYDVHITTVLEDESN
jgi:hypothetical protein